MFTNIRNSVGERGGVYTNSEKVRNAFLMFLRTCIGFKMLRQFRFFILKKYSGFTVFINTSQINSVFIYAHITDEHYLLMSCL